MKRNIVKIDEDKCNGCGLCVEACHEGALKLINGKAVLVSDSYCDGLGDCLPECPTGAITIEKREANDYSLGETEKKTSNVCSGSFSGCPGTMSKMIKKVETEKTQESTGKKAESQLKQWPVQLKLVAPNAPYFNDAHILVAADCTAFAYANIHEDFMKGKITLIGCPKLDAIDYSQKLTEILKLNNVKSVTVLKMEVPCCNGISNAVQTALLNCGKMIPWRLITVKIDGSLIEY